MTDNEIIYKYVDGNRIPLNAEELADYKQKQANPFIGDARSVKASQAKIALFDKGYLDKVETIVDNYPYKPVQIWWANEPQWDIAHTYVQAIGAELGLSDQDIQDLFNYAATRS